MSELAKRVAGTFIPDEASKLTTTLAWVTEECRSGRFSEAMKTFCAAQPEMMDFRLALAEQVTSDCIHGKVPCRCFDHESASTFPVEVRFRLNPVTGQLTREA